MYFYPTAMLSNQKVAYSIMKRTDSSIVYSLHYEFKLLVVKMGCLIYLKIFVLILFCFHLYTICVHGFIF